ncbi:MAG: ABC transporter permease [Flavitalea sp.]
MFKNLLLIAVRNFKRDKWYSLLNVAGLMIGITFSLFLIFYVKDELSYDKYNTKSERIYRINSDIQEPDKPMMKWAICPFPLGPSLTKDYPEVEEAVRFVPAGRMMYKHGDIRFYEEKIYFADSNVFRVFSYDFVAGNSKTALIAPNSIVLTESIAKKYFGNKTAVGESMQNDNGDVYKVTGVIKDVPHNSSLRFNLLISRSTLPADYADNWGGFNIYTYVLLKPNTDAALFSKKLKPIYDKYLAVIFKQYNIRIDFKTQKLTDIHLYSETANEPEEKGSVSYIYIFSAVAFFMLLIACINYMNLTTARSARRAKEIGVRKVTGSSKIQLVAQFLVESTVIALFALVLSMGLIALLLPVFNQLAGKDISFRSLLEPGTLLILLGIVIFVGLLGGSYPAFYLSKFNPIHTLKGSLAKGSSNVNLRRALVVTQFSISMIMIICTWIVYNQLKFLRSKDLGFNKQQVLVATANANKDIRSNITAFTNEVKNLPNVTAVSSAQATPGKGISFNLFSIETNSGYADKGVDVYGIDEHYFNTLGMKMSQGRNFEGLPDTLRSVIVNEAMVKDLAWKQAIGKKIKFPGDTSGRYFEVVGVVKDFNQKSLYNAIAPLLLFYAPYSNNFQIKLDPKNINATIASVERTWKKHFADLPFEYNFLDQDFDSQYAADQKRGQIFTTFSILTVMITCLGLLGLIAFTTQQRQKEISIRKIMGAAPSEIIPLITKNFVVLVGVSCLVAFPVAYVFMNNWLKIFVYNTGLSVAPFIFSALLVLVITLLTVMFHTVKASLANPVNNLRSE